MRTWYRITAKAETPEVAEIDVFDEIGMWGVNARRFLADLKQVTAPTVKLSINSPGGSVFDALAIFNGLRMSGKKIEVVVMGIAASAASYLMLAGDTIKMPENAMVMVHNPMGGLFGNAEEHRELADILDKVGANLQATYATRTGLSAEKVAELLSTDTFLTAAECKELGLCDEVLPALELKASYETENLPESVKALFKAAQPQPAPKAFGEEMRAALEAAGLGDVVAAWALDAGLTSMDEVRAAIPVAQDVRSICVVAGKPEAATEFIKARKSVADVRAALNAAAVAEDEVTDPVPATMNAAQPTAARGFNPISYWANKP